MPPTVPHVLIDQDGAEVARAAFAPDVFWLPGEVIVLGGDERLRVVATSTTGSAPGSVESRRP